MNILIVEDDKTIAKSIALALDDEGHVHNICGTAEDGLNSAREEDLAALQNSLG